MAQDYIGSWLYEDYLDYNAFSKLSKLQGNTIEDDAFSDMSYSFVKLIEIDLNEYVNI